MDAEDRKLLIDIHGTVSGIKPVLEANAAALRGLDERQRKSEILSAEHGVKIGRIELDLNGLGRKVRSQHVYQYPTSGGKWFSVFEFMTQIPKYWHVALAVTTTIGALVWGAHAHGLHR